jgi:hypothetical protein
MKGLGIIRAPPADPAYSTLSAVRAKFLEYFNEQQPSRGYKKFDPPSFEP